MNFTSHSSSRRTALSDIVAEQVEQSQQTCESQWFVLFEKETESSGSIMEKHVDDWPVAMELPMIRSFLV